MAALFDMQIIVSPLIKPVPVLQVSPDFQFCSDEFRRDMNAWLLEIFGEKEVCFLINGGSAVLVSPKQFATLRGAA